MKKILTFIFSISSLLTFAQGEMTLPMMEHVYQSSYYNPTAIPDHKVSLGLPGISSFKLGYINSGFQLLSGLENQNGVNVFNVNKFVQGMPANNNLHMGTQVDLFHLRFKWRNSFVSFDAGNTFQVNGNIPKSALEFATFDWKNSPGQDSRVFDLSSFSLSVMNYNNYSVGINKIYKHFNIGARFSLLQGIASYEVKSDNLQIGVASNAVSLNNSANVQSSGVQSFQDKKDSATSSSAKAIKLASQFKNIGGSVDFGVTYKVRDRLFIGVAVNNIGFIDWKNDIDNAKYYQTQEKGPFKGINAFGAILQGDSLKNIKLADSLRTYFKSGTDTSEKKNSYRTWLTPRVYLSVNYKLTNRMNVTALVKFEKFLEWRYAVTLGAQYKFGRFLSLTASSTYQYETISFGGGIVIKPGPFQLYIVGDNLFPNLYPIDKIGKDNIGVPAPLDSKMFNVRVGLNFVFGRVFEPKKQSFQE